MEGFNFFLLCLAVFLIFNWKLLVRHKKTIIPYLLWFLLGGLGIHAFYCKKTNWGLLTLLTYVLALCFLLFDGGVMLCLHCLNVLIQAFLIPSWIKQQKEKGMP
jgi:hypothetical protein